MGTQAAGLPPLPSNTFAALPSPHAHLLSVSRLPLPQVGAMWHLPREDLSLGLTFPNQVPLSSEEGTLRSEGLMERALSAFVNGKHPLHSCFFVKMYKDRML